MLRHLAGCTRYPSAPTDTGKRLGIKLNLPGHCASSGCPWVSRRHDVGFMIPAVQTAKWRRNVRVMASRILAEANPLPCRRRRVACQQFPNNRSYNLMLPLDGLNSASGVGEPPTGGGKLRLLWRGSSVLGRSPHSSPHRPVEAPHGKCFINRKLTLIMAIPLFLSNRRVVA